MASIEEKVKSAWSARFGVGKAPEALIKACAEKAAGLDAWQADLEIDSLVDAHARRHLAEKIGALGSYMEKALKALDSRLSQMEGPDGVDSVDKGMRLAERLDLKMGNRLTVMQDEIERKLAEVLSGIGKRPAEVAAIRDILEKQKDIAGTLEKQKDALEKVIAREMRPEAVGWLWPVLAAVVCVVIGMITGGSIVYQILKTGGASVW